MGTKMTVMQEKIEEVKRLLAICSKVDGQTSNVNKKIADLSNSDPDALVTMNIGATVFDLKASDAVTMLNAALESSVIDYNNAMNCLGLAIADLKAVDKTLIGDDDDLPL